MKANAIILTLFFLTTINMVGQVPPECSNVSQSAETVTTPYGAIVHGFSRDELTNSERSDGDSYYMGQYPDADPVYWGEMYYSSTTFNCHGYAWHMTSEDNLIPDLTKRIWIDDADKYITDGVSYKEVDTPAYPGWVYWPYGLHSARTTLNPDIWRSKWYCGPLMDHAPNDHPYLKYGYRYFKRCYKRQYQHLFDENLEMEVCKHVLEDCIIESNVELTLEFEDWLIIDGSLMVGSGAILNLHPKTE